MIFVGIALVAVLIEIRTGTSPVPTKSNPSITGFSTHPKACSYKNQNCDTASLWRGGGSKMHMHRGRYNDAHGKRSFIGP